MASHTTTNYTISQPTGVDGQVRLEAGTIDKTVSPEPAPVAPAAQPAVLPVAHTHAPGEEIDPKVIKQRKEQQKHLEKELDREAQLDEKEIKAREKDAKGVSKEEEKAHDAEEKARKAFEKVKAKYDSALQDLQEAQAELDSKIQDRARLTEQRRLAELKIQEQVQAKQSHDAARDQARASGPAAGL
ncbi:hypothetical protein C6P46_000174 [Rhodotorula mucilaginosa]|uniref:Uncharacterized protein n=1 Tax=Rhodotorula mucilaginosa TaxID=5537 RepID=A0A9P6W9C2_RHOMI|nr:hypothetical protein C6P46_000174 [Rhodotorula mucilaginosa]TKA58430.1 hypothetical protein B0A53_00169 [Rhodotorula sp. CCFEE 5036]